MKSIIFIITLLTFVLKSDAQVSEKSMNIQDYYDFIKDEWICDQIEWREKIVDIKNGYIAYKDLGQDYEPIFQMALFKDIHKKDLIIIHRPGYACGDIFDCPETAERTTCFLKYGKEGWEDVSHLVLPEILTEHFYEDSTIAKLVNEFAQHAIAYELPQFGQTIKLKLEICDDYINFDESVVSDEQIERLLKERKTVFLKWNKTLKVFLLGE